MTTTGAKPAASPDELLRAAVSGTPAAAPRAARIRSLRMPPWLRRNARLCGAVGAALTLGTALGAGATLLGPARVRAPDAAVAGFKASLEASRRESARLSGEIATLQQAVADLRGVADAGRKEAAGRGGSLGERLGQVERNLAGKIAALGERVEQAEREQGVRIAGLAAQAERRGAPPAKSEVSKSEPSKSEPVQTGSLPEPKPAEAKVAERRAPEVKANDRAQVIDGWAVRDVYEGTAILEDRRRRLVEVGPGDTLPGVGRVEAVERQGRNWVVVTRQGIVTPQPW